MRALWRLLLKGNPTLRGLYEPNMVQTASLVQRSCHVMATYHVACHVHAKRVFWLNNLCARFYHDGHTRPRLLSTTAATMSESEENFDLDVSDSEFDDSSPAAKKTTKAAPKAKAKAPVKPAAKTAVKPKATKKKVLVDKDDNASERDEDSDVDMAGPSAQKPAGKKKTASETYTKVSSVSTRVFWRIYVP